MVSLRPGVQFGKYCILSVIGRGSTGVVYLAEDSMLGRRVALKVFDRILADDEQFERRFRQEAQTIARIEHPNIVAIHALEKVGSDLAIDMAYVEGGSFEALRSTDTLAMQYVLRLARDVLEGLACCHKLGIIHRDVKPSNILIAPDGRALLSDFGLAKLLATHHKDSILARSTATLFVGTPRYAPPEAWDGLEPTPAWDVYSIGATVFEALALRAPYDADSPFGIVKQMMVRPVPKLREMLPEISEQLGHAVDSMLALDAEDRPSHAGDALEVLLLAPEMRHIESERGPEGWRRPVGTYAFRKIAFVKRFALRPWRLRRSVWIVSLAIALLLLVASLGALEWRNARYSSPSSDAETAFGSGNESSLLFDIVDPASSQVSPRSWLMLPAGVAGAWRILCSDSTRVWSLVANEDSATTLRLSGNWAEYTDPSAGAFRYGSISGHGTWIDDRDHLALSLTFVSAQDASEHTPQLMLNRVAGRTPLRVLLGEFLRSDYFQPILYNEIAPRGQAWLESIEHDVFFRVVPFISAERNDTTQRLEFDGRLDEDVWRRAVNASNVSLRSIPKVGDDNRLLACIQGNELWIGLKTIAKVQRPRVSIGLIKRLSIPAAASSSWIAELPSDSSSVESHYTRRGEKVAWQCSWKLKGHSDTTGWQGEVVIPLDAMPEAAPIVQRERWHITCCVRDESDLAGVPVAVWGSCDSDDLLCSPFLMVPPSPG